MDDIAVRSLLHGLCNALNSAKINTYLLRRAHGDVLDQEVINGLEVALRDAEGLISSFQDKLRLDASSDAQSTPDAV